MNKQDKLTESTISALQGKLTESVSWDYFDKFNDINNKYLPDRGEGDNKATQTVTAINKLIYKWYNDGDVFDNTHYLEGWANDLSSYANWLHKNVEGADSILSKIEDCTSDGNYELLLKDLADEFLIEDILKEFAQEPKVDSIYECDGPYEFSEHWEDEEEYEWDDEDEYNEEFDD